jgi:hypothetical membrane protein
MNRQHDAVPLVGAGTGTQSGGSPVPETLDGLNVLAVAGVFGPILFTVGFIAQGLYRPEYNPIAQQISNLTAGPYGWVQSVNFVVFGLLLIAFAIGLYRGARGARPRLLGQALVAWNGVELMVAGIFPLREDAAGRIYDPIGVHSVNGTIFFLSIGVGLVVLSRQFARDARWRGLATYTLATGIALLVMVPLNGFLAEMAQAPLHPWLGLIQRAILAVWFLCLVILALQLRRVGRRVV